MRDLTEVIKGVPYAAQKEALGELNVAVRALEQGQNKLMAAVEQLEERMRIAEFRENVPTYDDKAISKTN